MSLQATRARKRVKGKSDLPMAFAAAGSGVGIPIMTVNPVLGYIVVVAGAAGGYFVGKLFEEVMEKYEEDKRDS